MSRRNRNKNSERNYSFFNGLQPEKKRYVFAVLSFALGVIFTLAAFGKAGFVGLKIYGLFETLFGRAFFLAPLVFYLMSFSFAFFLEKTKEKFTLLGGFLFFLSSLGIVDILFGAKTGGYLGFVVSYPMLRLFDFWAGLVILGALFFISLILIFEFPARIFNVFSRKDDGMAAPEPDFEPIVSVPENKIKEAENAKDVAKNEEEEIKIALPRQEPVSRKSVRFKVETTWLPPPLELFDDDRGKPSSGDIKANANIIKRTLQNFGIEVEMGEVSVGPSITQYTLRPAQGIKLTQITSLQNDLALALAAHPLRIEAPIPGKSLVGIEVPNRVIAFVGLRSLLGVPEFQDASAPLIWPLGRDVAGRGFYANLTKMPHLLIAGSTGSGKSIGIHVLILALLCRNSPERLRFLIIDPKKVELTYYSNLPHLLSPVVIESKKAIQALRWAVSEMDRRFEILAQAGARDIVSYQNLESSKEEPMPYIVIVIDELADLMATFPREMEGLVVRLAQMSRAVGIHLVISTQRPSVEVITGLIKANITNRVAFQVASQVDSRTILDMAGAEKLLGNGDMLFLSSDSGKPRRFQGAFVSETEIKRVVKYLEERYEKEKPEFVDFQGSSENGMPLNGESFDEFGVDDPLYPQAKELILKAGKASASYLQRRFSIGYARAARLLDILEEKGVIGPGQGAKPREVFQKPENQNNGETFFNKENGL